MNLKTQSLARWLMIVGIMILGATAFAADTTPPDVSISSPSDGAIVRGIVKIRVFATGADIAEFYIDGNLIAVNGSPYSYDWNSESVTDGYHTIVVTVYDKAGNENSASISVIVANIDVTPPTITFYNPHEGEVVDGDKTIYATVDDDNSGLDRSELYIDDDLETTVTYRTILYSWDSESVTDGPHTITLIAYDNAGNQASASVDIIVDNGGGSGDTEPPTILSFSLEDGDVVDGTETVSVNANDAGGMDRVEFYVDGALNESDDRKPYNYRWNTTQVSDGSHTVMAVAYDLAGNSATVSATVTVDNGGGGDITPPTVAITSPSDGATVSGTETITAIASDAGGIGFVQFLIDGVIKAADATSPYSYNWDTESESDGGHTIMVTAWDNSGNNSSVSINVTVNNTVPDTTPPTVAITSPSNGETVSEVVPVTANASDVGGIDRVEFYVDAALKATDASSPYSYNWDSESVTNGSHTIMVKAFDNAGNESSASISVTVDNVIPDTTPPTVLITEPSDGATVNATISVTADASDAGGIGLVQFLIDGVVKAGDVTSPYSYSWDTELESDGSHSIIVRAFDNAGNSAEISISVTVNNSDTTPPTVAITSPANGATITSTITVTANASDASGIEKVEFYIDGDLRVTDDVSTYTYLWDAAHDGVGSHTIMAKAFDNMGNQNSASITVNCQQPPISHPADNRTFAIGDAIKEFRIMPGGASGYQLVQHVDVSKVPYVPKTTDAPHWWIYYRNFWDDAGVFIGDKALDKYSLYSIDDYVRGYDETIAIGPTGTPYINIDRPEFGNAPFFDTRVLSYYTDLNGFGHNGWQHHFRGRLGDGSSDDWIAGWSPLGPNYWLWDVPYSGITVNFRTDLDNYVWFIDNGYGDYNPGYCEWVMAGEVTKQGWGIVPMTVDPIGGDMFYQWIFVVPDGVPIWVGLPPYCTVGDYDPAIIDPELWVAIEDAAEEEAKEKAEDVNQNVDQHDPFGDLFPVEKAKEGNYTYIDEFGEAYSNCSLDQLKMLAEQDGRALIYMNGSGNTEASAIDNARKICEEQNSPVILVYMAQDLKYANANNTDAINAFKSLVQGVDNVGVPIDVMSHSWSSHLVGNALNSMLPYYRDMVNRHWAVNPAHRSYQDANDDWENYLSSTVIPTTILAGKVDAISNFGWGVGFWVDRADGSSYFAGSYDVYQIINSRSIISQSIVSFGGHTITHMYRKGMASFISTSSAWKGVAEWEQDEALLPDDFYLANNYPNPFNPTTMIEFGLPTNSHVRLDIYNILGQRVTTLIDKEMWAGHHAVQWDGKTESGQMLGTGIYFYRIQTEDFIESKKMLLLK